MIASCVHWTAWAGLVATKVALVKAPKSCLASQAPYSPVPYWYAAW